ncbi:MAG TPA: 16S rRNA (cytosine(1402)-N(4))-methyltransferase, partial [Usitatibacteraceae bacterium]|nr:16S rRNA (cytosine(1402)-N(4))-methyltransferase [Usitatibacteraceae bacterium]
MSEVAHVPVLPEEAVAALRVRADGIYVDGTFGRGGHSAAILALLGVRGRLLAFDQDPAALAAGAIADRRLELIHGRFSTMKAELGAR